jgi:PilZ domain-containing protein
MPDDPSSRKQSRIPAQDVRSEQRISVNESVQLSSMHQPPVTVYTRTQDISPHGARVITHQIWQPGSSLLLKSLRSDFWAEARVVYWRSFASSTFAIGLEFLIQTGNWPTQS